MFSSFRELHLHSSPPFKSDHFLSSVPSSLCSHHLLPLYSHTITRPPQNGVIIFRHDAFGVHYVYGHGARVGALCVPG